ncbi:MAG: (Fe-S)-binding protein [Dehalococcoidia bacterium]|nr:(Fe-S)-binding protein [Dehalococcoidia bacterium]MDD5494095.1 (Fe-S)-binding protein [Dehalococcoidia bacterium]
MAELKDIIRQTKAQFCLDCGKCTAVCPVSRFDAKFSPRLIVRKALRHPDKIYADENIWSCIGCNMCTVRCNYNVSYVDFIRYLRMKSRENGTEPVFSHAGVPESFMHLMAKKETKQNRLGWIPDDVGIDDSSSTAFFVGCAPYFDAIFQDIGVRATEGSIGALRLLKAAGISYNVLADERCCGHDLILSGDLNGFLDLGHANLEEFAKRGIKKIIVSCPECYYTLKVDYPRYFNDWNVEVCHITEVPEISQVSRHTAADGSVKRKVTYHDSCKLGRYFKMYDGPRNLLNSIAGVELVEMENNRENAVCCGASPWMYCGSINKQVQDERLRQAGSTGAELMVTSCPKCQIHLTCAQKSHNNAAEEIKIVDMYHLLSKSLARKEKD